MLYCRVRTHRTATGDGLLMLMVWWKAIRKRLRIRCASSGNIMLNAVSLNLIFHLMTLLLTCASPSLSCHFSNFLLSHALYMCVVAHGRFAHTLSAHAETNAQLALSRFLMVLIWWQSANGDGSTHKINRWQTKCCCDSVSLNGCLHIYLFFFLSRKKRER